MADAFSLRCYCFLDRMQAQYAAFVGTVTQGDLPTEGMAALYVEMAPGNEVFRVVDIAVKATEARPGAQIVEREFGMFEVHSLSQAAVLEAGNVVLARLGLSVADRIKPQVVSTQVITHIDPYQAQLINRFRRGSMLVPGDTMLVLECAPAAYINYAVNEAETGLKSALAVKIFGADLKVLHQRRNAATSLGSAILSGAPGHEPSSGASSGGGGFRSEA